MYLERGVREKDNHKKARPSRAGSNARGAYHPHEILLQVNGGMTYAASYFDENLFDDFFDDAFFAPVLPASRALYGKRAARVMKTDIREKGDRYELDIDLPGFKKDEVNITLENGYLTVSAAKSAEKDGEKKEEGNYLRRERFTGECSRSFYVGDKLQPNDVTAAFEDGILKLTVPKEAPKRLPEKTAIAIQ